MQDIQLGGPFQAVIDEQCIKLNRWHRGTPQSIILSHGFTFHHLVNPHTHKRTWSAHNISGCEKEASKAMITATDCCLVNVDLCRRIGGLNIIPACWGGSTEQGVRQRAKARLQGKSQPSLKWIMPLYRITACLTSCISVKERRFSLYKHVFSQCCSFLQSHPVISKSIIPTDTVRLKGTLNTSY